MTDVQAIILAVVEGITEFLPVSSTGHIIIASSFMGINEQPYTKAFTVIVQFGAIMSVLVLYWRRFLAPWSFYKKLLLSFLPAAVLGMILKDRIDAVLGSIEVVAYALIAGGLVLLGMDRLLKKPSSHHIHELPLLSAFKIGIYQCLAFVPGVSRSAASIIGGLMEGLDRKAAAEFSFFLAVPTLAGATFIKLLKLGELSGDLNLQTLIVGNLVSFFVAVLAIKTFMRYLSQYGFFFFGLYRIVVGVILLALIRQGLVS